MAINKKVFLYGTNVRSKIKRIKKSPSTRAIAALGHKLDALAVRSDKEYTELGNSIDHTLNSMLHKFKAGYDRCENLDDRLSCIDVQVGLIAHKVLYTSVSIQKNTLAVSSKLSTVCKKLLNIESSLSTFEGEGS